MTSPTSHVPVNLVVEDDLSEVVLRRILRESSTRFYVGSCYGKTGFGYIKKRIAGFNRASRGTPFFVLSDLEETCSPKQIREWLSQPMSPNLIFRIAVKEVESWVLADRVGFSSFLGIRSELIPANVDAIDDPKQFLIKLARRSRRRALREAIVPKPNSTAKVGPDYDGQLSDFVHNSWNVRRAIECSVSLKKAISAANRFRWELPSA